MSFFFIFIIIIKNFHSAETKVFSLIAAQFYGFEKSIPAFVNSNGYDILKGLTYASWGAGTKHDYGVKL
jgi:hypothetical protein